MKPRLSLPLVGHLTAILLGIGLAVGWPRGTTGETAAASAAKPQADAESDAKNQPDRDRQGNAAKTPSAEYAKAWERMWRDRSGIANSLLAEWAELDPAAALAAALAADTASLDRDPYGTYLDVFDDFISRRPMEFFALLKSERFGLATGLARRQWIAQVAMEQPGLLPTVFDELGSKDRLMALDLCFASPEFAGEQKAALIKTLAALPDNPRNRTLWDAVGKQLASQPTPDLLEQYAAAGDPGSRRIVGAALEQQVVAITASRDAIRQQLDNLPADLRSQVMEHILANPRNNAPALTLALDQVVNGDNWAARQQELCVRLHNAVGRCADPVEIAEWAGTLPEREDCEDLYRVGIRMYLVREPEQAWQWIGEMPSGWKRDNALAEYINGTLHNRNDETAAQRALDLIESEHFRTAATQMLEKWQAAQSKINTQ